MKGREGDTAGVPPDFLAEDRIAAAAEVVGLPREARMAAVKAAARMREDAEKLLLARRLYEGLFLIPDVGLSEIRAWPTHPTEPLGYGVLYLSRLEQATRAHASRGVPDEVSADTFRDLHLWIDHHHRATGGWGLSEAWWLRLHFTNRLFHLGRLQFERTTYRYPFRLLLRADGREVVVVAEGGLAIREDGQFADADGVAAARPWTTDLVETADGLSAHPLNARGAVLPEPRELDWDEWREVLRPGNVVVGVHIPEGGPAPRWGPLDPVGVADSFESAAEFFRRCFAEDGARAFACSTWLLDPQLTDYLPDSSNIVAFQRSFLLHPLPGASGDQTLERVVGSGEGETSLQRAIRDHLDRGRHWRSGGGLRPFPA